MLKLIDKTSFITGLVGAILGFVASAALFVGRHVVEQDVFKTRLTQTEIDVREIAQRAKEAEIASKESSLDAKKLKDSVAEMEKLHSSAKESSGYITGVRESYEKNGPDLIAAALVKQPLFSNSIAELVVKNPSLKGELSRKIDVSKLRFYSTNVTLQGAANTEGNPIGDVKVIKFPTAGTLAPAALVATLDDAEVVIGAWMELDSQPSRLSGIGNFTGVKVQGNTITISGQLTPTSAVFAKVTALYIAK